MVALTTDTFFNGRIQVKQDRFGYRFSIDAVLLAYHARLRPNERVIDLGTGCGIIPLILGYRNPNVEIWGIEIQEELARLATLNVEENRMEGRISVICTDMKALKPHMIKGPVDLVVSNPPFRKLNSGRINPDRQRAAARHEITVTLYDVVAAVRRILRKSGRFLTIYSAERATDLLTQMRSAGIEPKFIRMIHSGYRTEAKLILVEGVKGGRSGTKIGAPLIIYREDGSYTDEVERMFRP